MTLTSLGRELGLDRPTLGVQTALPWATSQALVPPLSPVSGTLWKTPLSAQRSTVQEGERGGLWVSSCGGSSS